MSNKNKFSTNDVFLATKAILQNKVVEYLPAKTICRPRKDYPLRIVNTNNKTFVLNPPKFLDNHFGVGLSDNMNKLFKTELDIDINNVIYSSSIDTVDCNAIKMIAAIDDVETLLTLLAYPGESAIPFFEEHIYLFEYEDTFSEDDGIQLVNDFDIVTEAFFTRLMELVNEPNDIKNIFAKGNKRC